MGTLSDELAKVEAKLDKGEDLTAEETKLVMSAPNSLGNTVNVPEKKKEMVTPEDPDAVFATEEEDKPKAPEKKPEPKEEDHDAMLERLHTELEKPEDKQDLSKFTPREKAYFREMKHLRKRAQRAEEENDSLKMTKARELLAKQEEKANEPVQPAKTEAPEEDDIFKGREKDDFITVEEVQKIIKATKNVVPQMKEPIPPHGSSTKTEQAYYDKWLKACDDLGRKNFSDYDEVMAAGEDIIAANPSYLKRMGEAVTSGENPAVVAYELVRKDPEFQSALIRARARIKARQPEAPAAKSNGDVENREKKIEENLNKPKTSAHYGGDADVDRSKGPTLKEITSMTDREFRDKYPRKKDRDAIMRSLGV